MMEDPLLTEVGSELTECGEFESATSPGDHRRWRPVHKAQQFCPSTKCLVGLLFLYKLVSH